MKNNESAAVLYEIADFLELQDVEYKPRAYRRAARHVESLSEPIEDVHARGELEAIEGVGESIAEKIAEYLDTGGLEYYEALKADLPIDIDAITSVEGVGPKTAKKLYRALGVQTLEDLERAAQEGPIAEVEGFGERSQQNILGHIELAKRGRERMLLGRPSPSPARSRNGSRRPTRSTGSTSSARSAAVDPRSATSTSWRRRPTPRRQWTASVGTTTYGRCSGGARRKPRSSSPAASTWTSGSWPTPSTAPGWSISPARRTTTSRSGTAPSTGG